MASVERKYIDPVAILRLIHEGKTQLDVMAILSLSNNMANNRYKKLHEQGLVEKCGSRNRPFYKLTPSGLEQINKPAPSFQAPPPKSVPAKPVAIKPASPKLAKAEIPPCFSVSVIDPHLFLPTTNKHPFYLNFRKINLMRFASRADAVIAANRLAEVIKWLNSPKFLDVMHDILLSADCVSPFYDNALGKMQRRQQASWAK